MYTFYGQFNPPVDQFIFERYFPDPNIRGVFVECGAFDGLTECSCKFFEEAMGWKGYNIEPVPWVYKRLCENRPDSTNINRALSNRSGAAVFHAVDHPTFGTECTNGSLAHTDAHKSLLQEAGCSFVPVEVSLMTWQEFVKQHQLDQVDLLVLDVEGHEISVIEGMQNCEVLPDVICIEVGHLELRDIRKRLERLGYTYDVSSHVNAFFVKTQKLPLFALRASASKKPEAVSLGVEGGTVYQDTSEANSALLEENHQLKKRIEELSWLNREMTSSKVWKLVERLRKWRN